MADNNNMLGFRKSRDCKLDVLRFSHDINALNVVVPDISYNVTDVVVYGLVLMVI